MLRGALIFRRVTDDDWLSLWPLIYGHRGPFFLVGPDDQMGPDCPDVLFYPFPHKFRDLCEGFGRFRRSFGHRGPSARRDPKTPRGAQAHPLRPPPLWLRACSSVTDFSEQKTSGCIVGKELAYRYIQPPPPPVKYFGQIREKVTSRESALTNQEK